VEETVTDSEIRRNKKGKKKMARSCGKERKEGPQTLELHPASHIFSLSQVSNLKE